MTEFNVNVDVSRCLTQNGFVNHLNEVFQFPENFWPSVAVVDENMQSLYWISENIINVTLINMNKAKKKPNDGSNHGLRWAIDRFEMYKKYWDHPDNEKSFNIFFRN